jgi:hypothetical protein
MDYFFENDFPILKEIEGKTIKYVSRETQGKLEAAIIEFADGSEIMIGPKLNFPYEDIIDRVAFKLKKKANEDEL